MILKSEDMSTEPSMSYCKCHLSDKSPLSINYITWCKIYIQNIPLNFKRQNNKISEPILMILELSFGNTNIFWKDLKRNLKKKVKFVNFLMMKMMKNRMMSLKICLIYQMVRIAVNISKELKLY